MPREVAGERLGAQAIGTVPLRQKIQIGLGQRREIVPVVVPFDQLKVDAKLGEGRKPARAPPAERRC